MPITGEDHVIIEDVPDGEWEIVAKGDAFRKVRHHLLLVGWSAVCDLQILLSHWFGYIKPRSSTGVLSKT